MPATRRVLKHLSIETAKARRKCHRTRKHFITKGEPCLVVQEDGFGKKNYCGICAHEILQQAEMDLDSLTNDLGLPKTKPESLGPTA